MSKSMSPLGLLQPSFGFSPILSRGCLPERSDSKHNQPLGVVDIPALRLIGSGSLLDDGLRLRGGLTWLLLQPKAICSRGGV